MAEKTILKPYISLTRSRFTKHHAQDSIVKNLFCGLVVLIVMLYPVHIQAQFADFGFGEKPPVEKLSAKGYLSIDKVQPGSQFQIAVVVEIVEEWHVNANPAGEGLIATEVIFPDTPHLTFGEVVYPTGEVLALGSIGEAPVYHDTITIGVQADLSQTAPIAPMMLDLELRYQACNDEQCLLPEVLTFAVPIEIVGIEDTIQRINEAVFANVQFGAPPSTGDDEGSLARALSGGQVWLAFLLVFAGGILTSLTPCVYPLIPITVSVFGANESASLLKSLLLSVVYVLGIVVTYSILGVAVASTGATFAVPIEIVGIEDTIQRINEAVFANVQFGAPPSDSADEGSLARALSGGRVWLAFLLVFAGGILTSLTPCVYPLIPITVSVFGANESASLLKSLLLSVVYVLGIVVTYSILGVAVASTGAVFGQIMANPWVVGFISLILVTLGLSMFGVFEIRLPYAVQNRLNTVGGTGFAGAFAMGTVAGVIAAPCTGPALAVVLTYIATTGSLFLGFWLMFTYAFGMGLLFIGIGTFSGLLSALPRSGGWMYVLENVFGIAIITMALYFLKDVFPPLQDFLQNSLPFFAIAGGLVLIGMWLGKVTQRFSGISPRMQFRKACGLLLAVLGAYMFVGGIQQPAGPHLNWVYDEVEGFEIAKREDKLVMLDFYASWCAACKELDHKTYADPAVAAKLDDYVNIKLDFTRSSETTEALTEKYQIPGLPVVILMDADGTVLKRFTGFVGAEEMLGILDNIEKRPL